MEEKYTFRVQLPEETISELFPDMRIYRRLLLLANAISLALALIVSSNTQNFSFVFALVSSLFLAKGWDAYFNSYSNEDTFTVKLQEYFFFETLQDNDINDVIKKYPDFVIQVSETEVENLVEDLIFDMEEGLHSCFFSMIISIVVLSI